MPIEARIIDLQQGVDAGGRQVLQPDLANRHAGERLGRARLGAGHGEPLVGDQRHKGGRQYDPGPAGQRPDRHPRPRDPAGYSPTLLQAALALVFAARRPSSNCSRSAGASSRGTAARASSNSSAISSRNSGWGKM